MSATIIKHKRSSTPGHTPPPSSLETGELAINVADGKLFTKKSDGQVVELSGGSGVGPPPSYIRTYAWVLGHRSNDTGIPLSAGANKANLLITEADATILEAMAAAKVGPQGNPIVIDLNADGQSLWGNYADQLRIPSGSVIGVRGAFTTTTLPKGTILTIDADEVGSTTPGSDVTVQLTVLMDLPG